MINIAKILDKRNSWEEIDTMGDSTVYKFGSIVCKDYHNLFEKVQETYNLTKPQTIEIVRKFLEKYYEDTKLLEEFFNVDPNPLRQSIKLGKESYNFLYKVISQGQLTVTPEGEVFMIGQKFIKGLNSLDIEQKTCSYEQFISSAPKYSIPLSQRQIILNHREFDSRKNYINIIPILKKQTGKDLNLVRCNVKPFIFENNVINPITDLTASIFNTYNKRV
jgi:hypothetical protein